MRARTKEPLTGSGVLKLGSAAHEVDYSFAGGALPGASDRAVRGSIVVDPETAREAFRAGEARLTVEGGNAVRLRFIGHSEGSPTAYFEAAR